MDTDSLTSAVELARNNPVRVPNESAEYRVARTALLAEEIELRRHIERVAAQRRSCSAANRRSPSTATCLGRNASARAPCAPTC